MASRLADELDGLTDMDCTRSINTERRALIGAGSCSEVYSAPRCDVQQELAGTEEGSICLKVLRLYNEDDEAIVKAARERLRTTMRNWHKLNHPNVNPFYGWAMDKISFGDNLCLVSGFCARYSVSRYLRSEPHPDRWKIIIEIAAGLCYLHQNSIIHGDLKPNNVLVDADGKARLCDFGLSIALSDKLTRPDEPSRFYTPAYLAPEMLEDDNDSENGCRPPTIQSDVWSFGCTAMQVLRDRPPYASLQVFRIPIAIMSGQLPFGDFANDSVELVLKACFEPNPGDRILMSEVVKRLQPPKEPEPAASPQASDSSMANNQSYLRWLLGRIWYR